MKRIGIIYGMENSFPSALVDCINDRNIPDVRAEHVKIGGVMMAKPSGYDVVIDRISHDIPFFRAWLKNEALNGCQVINNPFWWSADDKFFNYALASKLGVAVPATVMLPHRDHPEGTTSQSMRNLIYPLNWGEIFDYIGFPAFLKPHLGGGWKHVYKVDNPDEFYSAYNSTGTLGMVLQAEVNFKEYFRCYVIGREKVRIMPYDPRQPHAHRYVLDPPAYDPALLERVEKDALILCRALGYDLNTVEFAVEDGIPYAIDFLNPAPDADIQSVGPENFNWVVNAVADMAISRALSVTDARSSYHWSQFLQGA
ncbi:MAG: RimK family alpha-L-glutamate ligase [Bryobacteraceae bacterium]